MKKLMKSLKYSEETIERIQEIQSKMGGTMTEVIEFSIKKWHEAILKSEFDRNNIKIGGNEK